MLENTAGAIKYEQSRETGKQGTQDEDKQSKNNNAIYVGHINNVNKT